MTFLVACGLKREARLITRPGHDVFAVAGGGDDARLERELEKLASLFPGTIVSSGLAGALAPSLKPGAVVLDGDAAFVEKLSQALPNAVVGRVLGRKTMAATVAEKQLLHRMTGATAIDMESHVAMRVARKLGLTFGVLRVISDGAGDELPPAARVGMKPDGGMALGAMLASLARAPGQLPALIRTGRDAGRAFKVLDGLYDTLGRVGILGLDLRQFTLDVR